jgi:hypothetical protein
VAAWVLSMAAEVAEGEVETISHMFGSDFD